MIRQKLETFLFRYLQAVEDRNSKMMTKLVNDFTKDIEGDMPLLSRILPPPFGEHDSKIFKGRGGPKKAWNVCRELMINNYKNNEGNKEAN